VCGGEVYRLSDKKAVNPGAYLQSDEFTNGFVLVDGYLFCYFQRESSSPYTMIILAPDGSIVYRGIFSDKILLHQDELIYINSN